MHIEMTLDFRKSMKKLHKNQKEDLDKAIEDIVADVEIGKTKTGDLNGVRSHRFRMAGQMTLIAYDYEEEILTLTLLAFGSRENFYRDLKR